MMMNTKILPQLKIILMTSTDTGCDYIKYFKQLNFVKLSLIVTNPDRPRGRGHRKFPVKAKVAEFCDQKKICVFQPESVNSFLSIKVLKEISADIIIVVDFGQILSSEVLNIPRLGSFNIHYSLLPDLRGPEPVRWALLKGYTETGVTLIKMNEEIDKGEIVLKKETTIIEEYNYGILKENLTNEGVDLVKKFLETIYTGKNIKYVPQGDVSGFDYASKIDKKICLIDWNLSADEIIARIRAMSPEPGCWTSFKDSKMKLKIIQARKTNISFCDSWSGHCGARKKTTNKRRFLAEQIAGIVVEVTKKSFTISAFGSGPSANGGIEILKIQKEGKKIMDVAQFLAGNPVKEGQHLI